MGTRRRGMRAPIEGGLQRVGLGQPLLSDRNYTDRGLSCPAGECLYLDPTMASAARRSANSVASTIQLVPRCLPSCLKNVSTRVAIDGRGAARVGLMQSDNWGTRIGGASRSQSSA